MFKGYKEIEVKDFSFESSTVQRWIQKKNPDNYIIITLFPNSELKVDVATKNKIKTAKIKVKDFKILQFNQYVILNVQKKLEYQLCLQLINKWIS